MPKPGKSTGPKRKVVYNAVAMELCTNENKKPLTAEQAKKLLLWEEETDKIKLGESHLYEISSLYGKKVQCHNNVRNRPITRGNLKRIIQDILRRRWQRPLQDNIVIGRTGLVLNGQHRLIGLILAVQEWLKHPDKWPAWKAEPTIETTITFGADEDDATVNAMDTCKSRSLGDVIYRSDLLTTLVPKDRRPVARMLDYATRLLWSRTGVSLNAFAPLRTHGEGYDFIQRHLHLVDCARHIYEEDGAEGQVRHYISLGYASALMYLMGSSNTNPAEYRKADDPNESLLDWKAWDRASDFWVLLAKKAEEMAEVHKARIRIVNETGGSVAERCALLVRAWACYAASKPITAKAIKLEYHTDEEGVRSLLELPSVGGIDLGDPSNADEPMGTAPTPAEIQERAHAERDKRKAADRKERKATGKALLPTTEDRKKARAAKTKGKPSLAGKRVWIAGATQEENWSGKVVEITGKNARVEVGQGFSGAGNLRVVPVAKLLPRQPAKPPAG